MIKLGILERNDLLFRARFDISLAVPETHFSNLAYHRIIGVCLFLCQIPALHSQEDSRKENQFAGIFEKSDEPGWLVDFPVDPHEAPESASEAGSVFFLLTDNQFDIGSATEYSRYIKTLRTESGVQDGAQISVDVDPSYEKLRFHRLLIHRNGETIDRLPVQEFKTLQREEDHERQLYDSRVSVMAVLEDIRVGDTLEYAFSIVGSNPVFDGEIDWSIKTSYSVPVGHVRAAYRKPVEMTVFEKQHSTELARRTLSDGVTETVIWEADNPAPLIGEGELPWDYNPWGWIEISSYASWGEVAQWAAKQYENSAALPPELREQVSRISALPEGEAQVLAALRFVQDEIRYLGIFEGVHSHRPHAPKQILRRRFGDCKDKTLILVSVLKELGYEAEPALVETDFRSAIADWLPSPTAFDHVVTLLHFESEKIWLDPTRNYQRGKLTDLYFPDYGQALVISNETQDLSEVTPQGFDLTKMTISERFVLPDYSGPASLNVESVYEGRRADSIRRYFADTSRASIGSSYLNYYSSTYPDIKAAANVRFEDDEENNVFTVFEEYEISQIWEEDEDDPDDFEATFRSDYTEDELDTPDTKMRTMPFAIAHPVHVEHRITLKLPTAMDEESAEPPLLVEDPVFRYRFEETLRGDETEIFYSYQSLGRQVEPDRITEYLGNLDTAFAKSNYWLWISRALHEGTVDEESSEPYRLNWTVLVMVCFSILFSAFLCLLYARWKPPVNIGKAYDANLDGIGGWLVLPAIGLCLSLVFSMIIVGSLIVEYDATTWQQLTTPGEASYHALWEPALIFEVVSDSARFPVSILALVLFFRKHYLFPRLIVFVYATDLLIALTQWFLISQCTERDDIVSEYMTVLSRSISPVVIWIPYFLISVRVASTFRSGAPQEKAQPPGLPPSVTAISG